MTLCSVVIMVLRHSKESLRASNLENMTSFGLSALCDSWARPSAEEDFHEVDKLPLDQGKYTVAHCALSGNEPCQTERTEMCACACPGTWVCCNKINDFTFVVLPIDVEPLWFVALGAG